MTGKRNQSSPIESPSSRSISDSSPKELDRFLPIANVSRIMKKSLPANAKISKEAKETVQECVSEFISFITGEASDKCQREKRKTINGDDLLWAMTTLGFEDYVGPLKVYLNKYRETEGEKNSMPTGKDDHHHHHQALVSAANHEEDEKMNEDFQNFNMGFYSFGAQATTRGVGEGTRVIDYGENLGTEGFGFGRIPYENGEGNGNRAAMATTHVHGGVEW